MAVTALYDQLSDVPIIISTRLEQSGQSGNPAVAARQATTLSESIALQQLQQRLNTLQVRLPNESELQTLVNELGGLPLAIRLAAGYLAAGNTTEQFLNDLRNSHYRKGLKDPASQHADEEEERIRLHSSFSALIAALAAADGKGIPVQSIGFATKGVLCLGYCPAAGFGLSVAKLIINTLRFGEPDDHRSRNLLEQAEFLGLLE